MPPSISPFQPTESPFRTYSIRQSDLPASSFSLKIRPPRCQPPSFPRNPPLFSAYKPSWSPFQPMRTVLPPFHANLALMIIPRTSTSFLPTFSDPPTNALPTFIPPPPNPSPSAPSNRTSKNMMIAQAIGITVGISLGLTALAALAFYCWKRWRPQKVDERTG